MKQIILLLITSLILWSCKTHTVSPSSPSNIPQSKHSSGIFKMLNKKPMFQSLKIEANISIENGSFLPPANATIYIENGQKIWMNITAMFFNIARGVASPEGIKGYEKIGHTYIDSDFQYLNQLLNVNFIDYHSLQNLLTGKVFFPVNETDFSFKSTEKGYFISSLNTQKIITNGKIYEYTTEIFFSRESDLDFISLKDAKTGDTFEIRYSNWHTFEGERLPQNVKIVLKGKKNIQILLENTKFESSKMETPYSVPKNYIKKDFR